MEENELEEGEACSGEEEDACIDPDIALSYIDEKLQDVLGHFQKDFEGGVSAENLGAKFGGYGSFLPTYQRSPSVWSQPRSPPKPPSHNGLRSPFNPSEGACQNPSVQMSASISKNCTASTGKSLENSGNKGMWISALTAGESVPKHDSHNRQVNGSNQNLLKVRIKVGPDNISVRNNAAIYSGLGLDISPSSSPEDSSDEGGGHSPELLDVLHESPTTILQTMTCLPVLAGYFLSPLPGSLLHLTERGSPYLKNCGTDSLRENQAVLTDLSFPVRDVKIYAEKTMKSDHKNRRSIEVKNSNYKDDMSTFLEREIDIETLAGQELVSDALNIPLLSSSIGVDGKEETGQELGGKSSTIPHFSNSRGADGKAERRKFGESAIGTSKAINLSRESTRFLVNDRITSPDLKKNLIDSKESMENNRVGSSGNETTRSKGKHNSKLSWTEKTLEERKTIKQKDASSDMQREGRGKIEKVYNVVKGDFDGFKGRKDQFVGPTESVKQKSAQRATSYDQNGETLLQGKNQLSEGKKKSTGSQTNHTPTVDFLKENLMALSSVPSKEQKKSFYGRGSHSKAKSKVPKSCKEFSNGHCKGDVKTEQVENRTILQELHSKDMVKDMKLENERSCGKIFYTHLISEASVKEPVTTPLTCNEPATDAVAAPCDPDIMKDNWVCCDKCHKWRLLPYGTKPEDLPSDWLCSMQIWLPSGMNRCNVSEEDTTKAINPQYQAPVPESDANLLGHYDVGSLSTTSAAAQRFDQSSEPIMQSVPTMKKIHGLKDTSLVPSQSAFIQLSNSMKKNQQASRSLNAMSVVSLELDLLNKVCFDQTRKSADFTTGKQKHKHRQKGKHKILGCSSDHGGDLIEQSGKYSKSKSKREVNQNGFRAAKKIKTDGSHCPDKDWHCDPDVAGKSFFNMANGSSTSVIGKNLDKRKGKSSFKESKSDSRGDLLSLNERSNAQFWVHSDGGLKEYLGASDKEKSDKLDLAAKKRKVKEWKESQSHQETLTKTQQLGDSRVNVNEEFSDSELRNDKKTKVSKFERKESSQSKADSGMDITGRLSCSKEQLVDGMEEQNRGVVSREHRHVLCQGNVESRWALDGVDFSKRDLSNLHLSASATSSSSKVSGSRKSKAKFQEARCSPVESVTSSPFMISNTDKLATRRNLVGKDDAINLGCSVMESPKKCSDGEVDAGSDPSGTRRKEKASFVQHKSLESERATEYGVPDSLRGTCNYRNEVTNQLSCGEVKGGMHLKTSGGTHGDLLPTEFGESNVVSDATNTLDLHQIYIDEPLVKGNVHDQDKLSEPTGKGHAHEQNKVSNRHHTNGSSRWKSDKSSPFMEGDRSSEYDSDKCNLKVSDSVSEQNKFYSANYGDLKDANYNFQQKDDKGYLEKKDASVGRRDHHLNYGIQENLDKHLPPMTPENHKDPNSRVGLAGARCVKVNLQEKFQQAPSNEDEKLLNRILSDHIDQSEMATGRGNSELTRDKLETLSRGSHSVPIPVKGSRSEVYPTDAAKDAVPKVVKPPKKSDNQNVVYHRHPTPNELDARSPSRKDGHPAATVALKEARDLKHMANRLKNEGQELESTGLYFQAALKFLHVACLWEPSSVDSIKHGEVTRSMQMYADTAGLCQFCAHEYERCKEMAAAALAYKCMEVAYFKVAYFKQPISSKDRHELQTALQMVLQGESPSSSASDVDNMNNQGTLDKAASAKGVTSLQIAGNDVIAGRSSYTRWLDYTNDTIFAFEASRKSQSALAAATTSLEKDGANGISSVKQVLNFNFHNVEELLRLIRLSIESISH